MKEKVSLFWFRRDLRLTDNAGLYHALKAGHPVLPVFIFDRNILDKLGNKKDPRVEFIFDSIQNIKSELEAIGSTLHVFHGEPVAVFTKLSEEFDVIAVYANEDYEPYAAERDAAVGQLVQGNGAELKLYKDQVIFAPKEVLKDNGEPYTVFTPYSKKWKATLTEFYLQSYPTEKYFSNFFPSSAVASPSLESMGFERSGYEFPPKDVDGNIIEQYHERRNFPGIHGTSHLGLHLRFGTISIRKLASRAAAKSSVFLNELIWRDFYQMILGNFPQCGAGKAFKPAYDRIRWRNDEDDFAKWCAGQTGYPIVDAGMRELNATGFMHNRVRMITASFLCKDLLLDWRWGEAYFAEKLLDYDLASNNGGWQWAAGSGCDAAPYFRIFNPALQTLKFDPEFTYIRKWVPEFEEFSYPKPIVDHSFARDRCLEAYKAALNEE